MKVRELTADEVVFSLKIEEDDLPMDFDSGDKERDGQLRRELKDRLADGDLWAWCTVVVTAQWKDWKGEDTLGGCSYKDEADFRQDDGYFGDMKDRALEDLNKGIARTAETIEELLEKGIDVKPLAVKFERQMGGG